MIRTKWAPALLVFLSGCAAVSTFHHSGVTHNGKEILLSTDGIDRPYRSIGLTQATVTGVWLFGFIEIMPAKLEDAFRGPMMDEAVRVGADAIININWYETQYPLLLRIVSIFSIVTPQMTIVTGELVEFTG